MPSERCPACGANLPPEAGGFCGACAFGDAHEAGAGYAVEGHEVGDEIARGGAGIVYRARQLDPAREVALKMMLPQHATSPEAIARFRLEASTVAGLDHPAILPLYATGQRDGLPWFTMKLASGGSLAERASHLRGCWREIAHLLRTLAEAVQFAHSRGVLHRDLKPSNVLFDEAGRPYVSDFGIAKIADTELGLTLTQGVLGTPAYLAPEVAEAGGRAATTASDVYALGAILYELLSGRPPFRGETLTHLLRQVAENAPAELPPEVPRDLAVIARCALEKSPAARISSAAEFAAELERWLAGRPIRSRPASRWERLERWTQRNPALAGLSGALVLGTLAGGLALWQSNRELTGALGQARAAAQAERTALREALVAQARGLRRSGQQGQSLEALRLLRRATDSNEDLAWRAEAAAALALPDAEWIERELPASVRSYLSTVAFSGDFTRYACAAPRDQSQLGDAVIRDANDGRILQILANPHQAPCEHFRFSPSGRLLRVLHSDGTTFVWDLQTRAQRSLHPPAQGTTPVVSAFGADDAWHWLQADGWLMRQTLEGETARVAVAAGALWVAPRTAGSVLLGFSDRVEARTQTLIEWSIALACTGTEPAWTRDRSRLAIAERARAEVVVLSTLTGEVQARLNGHSLPATFLAFHPAGEVLATLSPDRSLRWWNSRSGETLWQGTAAQRVLAWSPDGRRLAVFRVPLQLAMLATHLPEVFREFPAARRQGPDYFGMAVDPDGERIVTCDPGAIRLWNVKERTVAEFPCPAEGVRVAYPVDPAGTIATSAARSDVMRLTGPEATCVRVGAGKLIAAGPRGASWLVMEEGARRLWLWPAGDPAKARLLREGEHYFAARLSPDRLRAVLLGSVRPLTEIVDFEQPARRQTLELGAHAQVDWSPDAAFLLTGTPQSYRVYRAADWQLVKEWPATLSGEPYASVAWSPDGRWVATQSGANEVEIRSTSDWRVRHRLESPAWVGALHDLAFSPDATRLRLFAGLHQLFEWDLTLLELELAAIQRERPTR